MTQPNPQSEFNTRDSTPDLAPGTPPELDHLLAALRSATPRPGFEGRVLAHLQRESRTLQLEPRTPFRTVLLRRLAPMAIAASLVCVVTGGVAVQREYSMSLPANHATQASIMLAGTLAAAQSQAQPAPLPAGPGSFGTASARREPAGAIPTGTRKGRATRSSHTRRPLHDPAPGSAH